MWLQRELSLAPKPRGFHLVTAELLAQIPELREVEVGLLHLLLTHTSASLSLNENADPAVRRDLARHSDELAQENAPYYEHLDEGPDDMPAHIKSALFGVELTLPLRNGAVMLGTWQGIYLGEHRDRGGSRRIVATLTGRSNG